MNCPDCWHLMSLHGPDGCTAKVYPAHSLTGKPCPCGPATECSHCGERIAFLGGSWTTDDGTIACYANPDTSAPFVPHKPKEG